MIQRIQSVYLSGLSILMLIFLKLPIWEKVGAGSFCTIYSYGLIALKNNCIIFPYAFSALLAFFVALIAIYAIIRNDNRVLQLRLILCMNLTLVLLLIFVLVFIKHADAVYLVDGCSTYKPGVFCPFTSLIASLLAGYHIKKDQRLVNESRLR